MCCGARAWRRVALVAGLLLIGLGFGVQAQDQPKQDQPKYEVTGFRDARFGMTEAEVAPSSKNLSPSKTQISSPLRILRRERPSCSFASTRSILARGPLPLRISSVTRARN